MVAEYCHVQKKNSFGGHPRQEILKIKICTWNQQTNFLSNVHRKLTFLVSFCVRRVDFSPLAGKSIYRTQNDTDSANYRYTANKKNRLYHATTRIRYQRLSALDTKYTIFLMFIGLPSEVPKIVKKYSFLQKR